MGSGDLGGVKEQGMSGNGNTEEPGRSLGLFPKREVSADKYKREEAERALRKSDGS